MAKTLYFAPDQTVLQAPWNMDNREFATKFPGASAKRCDSFSRWVGYGPDGNTLMPVARIIHRKSNPSNHKCDARCQHAKGHNCECSCGGKNHGAGGC
jgi:hypothetical protein